MIFTDGSTSYIFSIQVVIFRDGTYLTLREVFESLDLTGYLFCPIFNIFNFLFMFLYNFFVKMHYINTLLLYQQVRPECGPFGCSCRQKHISSF